jgi:alanine racemase
VSEPSTDSQSRAWVEVNLDALCANAEHLRRTAGPEVTLLPMVKADAYGLGMLPVAKALAGAFPASVLAGFGVAAVQEGEALRSAGWRGRILVFSPVPRCEFERAAAAGLALCLSDVDAVEHWAGIAERTGRRLPMHLEVDTGMGRAGFPAREARDWGARVAEIAARGVRWEGVFTHFHSADEPDLGSAHDQWRRFQESLAALPPRGADEPALITHVSNSAAAMRLGFRCDWVRPGIFLYGGRVGGEPPQPVVSVRARLSRVRDVPAGTTVGYGATYTAAREERWGTLCIGYGDGLRRTLGTAGGEALIAGRRVPIIGRISMDMTTVDVTGLPEARVDRVATLIGEDGADRIDLDEVARRCETISYEILTGLTPRLPRVYGGVRAAAVGRAWAHQGAAP